MLPLVPAGPSLKARAVSSTGNSRAVILIQPATHVVKDEEAYRKSITEGLDLAVSRNSGIVFTICETGVENHEVETGIQVWPLGMLIERLRSASFHEARSYQEALSQNSTSLSRFPLGASGRFREEVLVEPSDWLSTGGSLCDRILVPIEARLRDALSSLKVYVDQAESLLQTVRPFEVIEKRPGKITSERNPGLEDTQSLFEVVPQV